MRWKHQTPRSPWMGGHFERLVRTIKVSLATAISRKLLTLEEFSTVVKEAENIVNSRPLTYQSDSTRDVPLSPSQLAWGRDLTFMPPLLQPGGTLDEDHDARATRAQYELLSNALEHFRKRWHEYLLSLREKHYNRCAKNPTHHLSVGKLVMVRHDNVHRIEWPLGVITAIYPDDRGVIRTAEVEECGKRSLRPVRIWLHWNWIVVMTTTHYVYAHAIHKGTKKMTPTTTKRTTPSLRMTTHYSLRTKEVQLYQLMLRDRSFFPMRLMQSHFIRRATPERAAWPTAPLLGATYTPTLLPTPSHHLSHQPQSNPTTRG